jgi:hypothetical protein
MFRTVGQGCHYCKSKHLNGSIIQKPDRDLSALTGPSRMTIGSTKVQLCICRSTRRLCQKSFGCPTKKLVCTKIWPLRIAESIQRHVRQGRL